MRFDGEMDIEVVALSVARAAYLVGQRRTHLFGHLTHLSYVQIAAVMVACYADQTCPGDRPAGAGDLLAAAASRADQTVVSVRRSTMWGEDTEGAVESILKLRDQEAAKALLADIMLLVPEVLP